MRVNGSGIKLTAGKVFVDGLRNSVASAEALSRAIEESNKRAAPFLTTKDVIKQYTSYRTFTVSAFFGQKIDELRNYIMNGIGQAFIDIAEESPQHHHFIHNISIDHCINKQWFINKQEPILKFTCVVFVIVFYREKENPYVSIKQIR